jgi:hypothetical protein
MPHLVMMGLLVAGLVTGVRLWWQHAPVPGLELSLFWGGVNLILVSVAILAAAEIPEWRTVFRIKRRRPCELMTGEQRFSGIVVDINETGARIHLREPLPNGHGRVRCRIKGTAGAYLTLEANVCRQIQLSSSAVEIGVTFVDVEEQQIQALIVMTFSDASVWNQPEVEPGIFRSLWSVIRVFHKLFAKRRVSHRRSLRSPYRQNCLLVFRDRIVTGRVDEISQEGCSIQIPGTVDVVGERGVLYVDRFSVKIRRVWAMPCGQMVMTGFAIERGEKGADQWQDLTARAA